MSGWVVVGDDGVYVGLYRADGQLHAFENVCPHQGGPVCRGSVFPRVTAKVEPDGRVVDEFQTDRPHIVCPWHGWEFELPSGLCTADERWRLRRLEIHERDGRLYASVPDRKAESFTFAGS